MNETRILPLHHHPEHIEATIDVLVEEWPRSRAVRRATLEKSTDRYPNLALLKNGAIVGHSMLSQVVGRGDASFVEAVVISKSERGKGLGRELMTKTEEYAISVGIKTLYLTTHDKQGFYERVGYEFCKPVLTSSFKSSISNSSKIMSMLQKMTVTASPKEEHKSTKVPKKHVNSEKKSSSLPVSNNVHIPPAPAPPPPPPPPAAKTVKPKPQDNDADISWMKKELIS